MPRSAFAAAGLLVALLLSVSLAPARSYAQSSSSPAGIVQALGNALDTLQGRVNANDQPGARAAYDAFENVWFGVEDTVRGLSGGSYRAIEDAMRNVRDSVYGSMDPARARDAVNALRGEINTFAASAGVAPSTPGSTAAAPAAAASGGATAAPATAPAATAAPAGPSTEECARYSGRAALPYFDYARQLAGGATLPGIPPAQAVTPLYSYGPSPFPGTVAAGPFRPTFPYLPRVGPGAVVGGFGVGGPAGNLGLTAANLQAQFQAGGQLPPLPNPALAALGVGDIIGLAGQQAAEIGNRIALGDAQQSLVGNQLGYSDVRSTWVGTYLSMSEQARDIALSLCGRIPG